MNLGNGALLITGTFNVDPIPAGQFAFLAARVALQHFTARYFNGVMASVRSDDQAGFHYCVRRVRLRHHDSLPDRTR